MSSDLYFDNLIITDKVEIADTWAKDTFDLKVQKLDVNDAGIFKRILNYSNRNPWLYAVYVVVIGLPLVLIITFCCSSSSTKKVEEDPKKTDAVQEDDTSAAQEEEDEEEEEENEDEENEDDDENVELIPDESDQKRARRRVRKD